MRSSYSPIDESSFSDTAFDPEAFLRGEQEPQRVSPEPPMPEAAPYAPQQPQPQPQQAQPQAPKAQPRVAADAAPRVASNATKRMKRVFTDGRTAKFIGLVLLIAACYALIATISYFSHIGTDQSSLLNGIDDPTMIKNTGGLIGARVAHTLIYDWLGIGSFILIYYLGAVGLKLLNVLKTGFWGLTMRCLLTAISISIILGFATSQFASPFYWGGRHGQLLNERLTLLGGIWASLGVSIVMAGMLVILYLNEVKSALSTVRSNYSNYRERQAERHAERQRIEAEENAAREAAKAAAQAARQAEPSVASVAAGVAGGVAAGASVAAAAAQTASAATQAAAAAVGATATVAAEAAEVATATAGKGASLLSTLTKSLFTKREKGVEEIEEAADNEDDDESMELVQDEPAKQPEDDSLFSTPAVNDEAIEENAEVDSENENESFGSLFPSRGAAQPMTAAERAVNEQPLFNPRSELSHYKFPSLDLLRTITSKTCVDTEEMEENKARISATLESYGISISKIEATVGPTVTLYEIVPAEGVRIAKIKRLEDDIALNLAALGIRIIAPIPGKGTIGIEVPNKDPQTVSMRSILESETFANSKFDLPMALGRTISNEVFMADLCKMPHLLVAGATGMGKSVGLNAIIASLLYKKHPAELKFVLIDPKMVEFSLYAKLERHYLAKLPDEEDAVITDPSKVVATLNSLCLEMDNRYMLLKDASMRTVKEYNERFCRHELNPEKGHKYMPYIVVVVDEFADLIMTAGKEVETPIARIAQKARAVGIHMILATQRPSTNVITGLIKANFPGRIAFRVFQMVDSRTILDRPGANQLIGRGDMLFSDNGRMVRVQCAFIDTPEVNAICDHIDRQVGYPCAYELPEYIPDNSEGGGMNTLGDRDPLFDECARLVVTTDTASTSSLQRRYSIGYNRAGKIMDQMEAAGIVGPSTGGKPRQVLVDPVMLEKILEQNQ